MAPSAGHHSCRKRQISGARSGRDDIACDGTLVDQYMVKKAMTPLSLSAMAATTLEKLVAITWRTAMVLIAATSIYSRSYHPAENGDTIEIT